MERFLVGISLEFLLGLKWFQSVFASEGFCALSCVVLVGFRRRVRGLS